MPTIGISLSKNQKILKELYEDWDLPKPSAYSELYEEFTKQIRERVPGLTEIEYEEIEESFRAAFEIIIYGKYYPVRDYKELSKALEEL